MRIPVVIEGPAALVTPAEARTAGIFSADDGDAYVAALLAVAQSQVDGSDGTLGRALGLTTLELVLPASCYPEPRILPLPEFVELVSDTLADDGRTRTVRWKAGYVAGKVPAAIKHAVILMAGVLRDAAPVEEGALKSKTIDGIGRWDYAVSTGVADAMQNAAANLLQPFKVPRV